MTAVKVWKVVVMQIICKEYSGVYIQYFYKQNFQEGIGGRSRAGRGGGGRGRGQRVSSVFHYWVGMGGRSDVEWSIYLYICIARTTTVR